MSETAELTNGHSTTGTGPGRLPDHAAEVITPTKKPRGWLRPVLAALAVVAAIFATIWFVHARHFENTDDAFIEGRVIPVAAKVEGYITSLNVDDNQHVNAGDVIASVDPRDFEAALAEASANLCAGQSRLADANAHLVVLRAQVDQADAALAATQAEGEFAKLDAERYRRLGDGVASLQDRQRADSVGRSADAKIRGARSNVEAAKAAASAGVTAVAVAQADVDMASSKLKQPQLNLEYTKILAPQSGRIARRTVERGSYVKPGQSLLAIVPDEMWVLANFKENQLLDMKPGQPVELLVDAYPGRTFSGTVDSIQAGSGGRFSLLPPENATGNYVKVVQRVPVKIRFTEGFDSLPLLAPGMSVEPEVRVR